MPSPLPQKYLGAEESKQTKLEKTHNRTLLRKKTARFITATKTSSNHKEDSTGSEAFLSLPGGMSAMLHEFLPEQFVPITY